MATLGIIKTSDMMRRCTLTVEVSGLRAWRWRIWLGLRLIRLACRVIGCGIRVDTAPPCDGAVAEGCAAERILPGQFVVRGPDGAFYRLREL